MNILITLDYELYFGPRHGTVDRCLIGPTDALIRLADKHRVPFVFFVDCGFLLKLKEYGKRFPALEDDYRKVNGQLATLSDRGHELQLHIHPHWEDALYDGRQWVFDMRRYKLSDFDAAAIDDIVKRYKEVLQPLARLPVRVFRAGGWCLQPFDKLKDALYDAGIVADSSVFRNGRYRSARYDYDFRGAPAQSAYRFSDDPVREDPEGVFVEYPITPVRNSPLFFWKLFLLGRLNPYLHKPLGDGQAMAAPGQRTRLLTRFTDNCVSIDGYNARLLFRVLRREEGRNAAHLVIIGHPKALSRYSLAMLDQFIGEAAKRHLFRTFAGMLDHDPIR